jgi:putative transposase
MARSESEWLTLLKRQKESGLSQRSFCEREGVGLKAFEHWKRRARSLACAAIQQPHFIEVELPSATERHIPGPDVEVALPFGVVVRFFGVRQ